MTRYYLPISLLCSAALLTACGDDDAPINEAVKGSISLTGTARVNETLSIENAFTDRNGVNRITPSYQWYGDGVAIDGATESTYTLTPAELDQDVHVIMDFLDDDGFPETLTSNSFNIYYPYTITLMVDRELTVGVQQSTDFGASWSNSVVPVVNDVNERHYYPSIATDGQGNMVAVAVTEYNPNYGGEYDIVVTSSNDNGATWSDIKLLVPTDTTDSQGDEIPKIATDKNGNWMVVWESGEDVNGAGTDTDILYSLSVDNGITWSAPEILNPWGDSDSVRDASPNISMNGDNWAVSWSSANDPDDGNQSDFEIYTMFSSDAGTNWSSPRKVSIGGADNTTDDTFPVMDINEETGRGVLIWSGREDGTDLDVYVSTTPDFGETWTAGLVLNDDAAVDGANDIDRHHYASSAYIDSDGNVIVGWYGQSVATGTDDEVFYEVSANNGANWSETRTLSPGADEDTTNEFAPLFLANPHGGWIASWVDTTGKIYVSQSEDLQTWSETPVLISEDSDETTAWVLH